MAKKLWVENIDFPAAIYQESQPEGDWSDMSSDAVSWDLYGHYVIDYLFYRDKISTILFIKANPNYPTIDFSGFFSVLTDAERMLMCKYILAPYALRTMVVSETQDYANWELLLQITQGTEPINVPYTGRALLIEKMRKLVAHKVRKEQMGMANSQQFFKDVFHFTEWYIRAACPDFKLWITNAAPYDTDGFDQKAYYSETLRDELMDIYENG